MKNKSSDQLIFPIIVLALSLVNMLRNFQDFYWTSILVSLIGISASVLFFLDNKKTSLLFYTWIISQLVTYTSTGFAYYTDQFPNVSISIKFQLDNSLFAINFLPLFYFIGYRILKMYDLIGKMVSIKPIKVESNIKSIDGIIIEIVNLNKDGKWLKVEFKENNDSISQSVLIKPKGEERFSRKASIFAFVKESSGNYSFIDWGKVKLK